MPDIVTTETFISRQRNVSHTNLNNIVGHASIQTTFVTGKSNAYAASEPAADTDQLLVVSGAGPNAAFKRLQISSLRIGGKLTGECFLYPIVANSIPVTPPDDAYLLDGQATVAGSELASLFGANLPDASDYTVQIGSTTVLAWHVYAR